MQISELSKYLLLNKRQIVIEPSDEQKTLVDFSRAYLIFIEHNFKMYPSNTNERQAFHVRYLN